MKFYFKKIIGIFILVVVFFLILEISARVDDTIKYDAPFFGYYSSHLLRMNDSDGIRCNTPGGRFEKWRNNNFGFRGEDFPETKPAGITRIAAMGTSETYGLFERPGKEWPAQLSDLLNPYDSFHVFNASTVGLPIKDYSRYIKKYVDPFDPDYIILFLSGIGYINGLERTKPQVVKTQVQNTGKKASSHFSLGSIIRNIRILPKIKQMIKGFIPEGMLFKYQLWDREKAVKAQESRLLRGVPPLDKIPEEHLNKFRDEIDSLIVELQNDNQNIILTTYPVLISHDNIDLYPEIFLEARRFGVELSYIGYIDASKKCDSIIKDIAEYYDLPCLDINSQIPKNTNYFGDNVHLRDSGAQLIAEKLTELIISRLSLKDK